ncbi:MAG: hypothetical protein V4547_11290 [Bacteroidota bacterium]
MKKIILLIFTIIASFQLSFAQNTIAKLKYEEAEEAYANNNFELALSKLIDVETILKSTNPKILYLKINSQAKIIEKDPFNDYALIENARTLSSQYLTDYEQLPDNEDRYREIYKISEKLESYPKDEKAFALQKENLAAKKRSELAHLRAEEELKRIEVQRQYEEQEKRKKEQVESIKKLNHQSFANLGIQTGSIAKYGIVMEFGSEKRFGFRMSVRGSFIFGENVAEYNKIYVPQNDTKQGRFAIDIGPNIRLSKSFYLYAGGGLGSYSDWTLNKVYSKTGYYEGEEYFAFENSAVPYFETSIGAIVRLGRVINLNGGFSFINLSSPEFNFGISFNLLPKI